LGLKRISARIVYFRIAYIVRLSCSQFLSHIRSGTGLTVTQELNGHPSAYRSLPRNPDEKPRGAAKSGKTGNRESIVKIDNTTNNLSQLYNIYSLGGGYDDGAIVRVSSFADGRYLRKADPLVGHWECNFVKSHVICLVFSLRPSRWDIRGRIFRGSRENIRYADPPPAESVGRLIRRR
jgi:hypothetical protein